MSNTQEQTFLKRQRSQWYHQNQNCPPLGCLVCHLPGITWSAFRASVSFHASLKFQSQAGSDEEDCEYGFPIYHHPPHPDEEGVDDEDAAEHSARVPCSPSLKYVDETRRSDQSVERPARSFSPGRTCSSPPPA